MLGSVDGAMGRQVAARQIGDTLAATMPGPGGQNFRQYVSLMPIIGGFADSAMLARCSARLDSAQARRTRRIAPFIAYYRAMIALDQGQPAKAGSDSAAGPRRS